jgi:hypothetical protein
VGRSTYGECLGALSWAVAEGYAGDVELSGLAAVLALRYHDDEPGSPWTFWLYVDERGDERQRGALADILCGRLGGAPADQFPWVFKASELLGVRAVPIEVDHSPRRGWFRAGDEVSVRVRDPVPGQDPVTCVVPGHHRPGEELVGDVLRVAAPPLEFELDSRCAYRSTFDYGP